MTPRAWLFLLCLALCTTAGGAAWGGTPAHSSPAARHSAYEAQAVNDALAHLDLAIESHPEGKRVGKIHVATLSVFSGHEGALRWLNVFHTTTRRDIVRREVLLLPGSLWNQGRAEETERILRNPLFSSLAALVPVQSRRRGYVDVLVVTRDVWSLRTNSDFEIQGGSFSRLVLKPSENNFLGHRKQVSAVFDMDLGAYLVGPSYLDPNIAGTHMRVRASGGIVFNRATGKREGSRSTTQLAMPLWSLERQWGASIRVAHDDSISRLFRGTKLATYDAPETPEDDAVPYSFEQRSLAIDSAVVHAVGADVKVHLTLGHELRVTRPRLLPSFGFSPVVRDAFARDVLPRSERSSALFLRYRIFTPTFVEFRNISGYDLPEIIRVGPDIQVELATAARLVRSERNFVRLRASGEWAIALARDALARLKGSLSARFQGAKPIDNQLNATVDLVSPELHRALRVVLRGSLVEQYNDVDNKLFVLGGQTGLRGYPVGAFSGKARVLTSLEVRSSPVPVSFARAGALVFFDVGHAGPSLPDLALKSDVGVGLRVLIPQTSAELYRIDWAFPLEGKRGAWPGRLTLGFQMRFR